jgi:hypothetical protein
MLKYFDFESQLTILSPDIYSFSVLSKKQTKYVQFNLKNPPSKC